MSRALAAVILVTLLGGCTAPVGAPSPAPAVSAIAHELELARLQGAAPEQLDALASAQASGEVTLEQVRQLDQLARECTADAGLETRDQGQEELVPGSGWFLDSYVVMQPEGVTDDAINAIMLDCSTKYVQFVESAFMMQPEAVALRQATWDTPGVRACLAQRGYVVEADATGGELEALATDDAMSHAQTDPGFVPCMPE